MPGRIEKTVFISYRHANFPWAFCIYQDLTHHGFDVFFDFQSINSGDFEKIILENIKARAHFIVILAPSALERCSEPNDWLRREIETAIHEGRNIIPITLESFDFGSPFVKKSLTGKLATLSSYNAMSLVAEYMEAGLEKLRNRYLNVTLEDIPIHKLADDTKEITNSQKEAANEAEPVKEEQLTAQTWFERGYVFAVEAKNPEEAIRCFSEAIRLDPNLDVAYNNLGAMLDDQERHKEAEAAYRRAIELNPAKATAYYNLGLLQVNLKRFNEAEFNFRKAIELDPLDAAVYNNLGNTLMDLDRYDEAEVVLRKAIELDPSEGTHYYNLGGALKDLKRYDEAEIALRKAIELNASYVTAYTALGNLLRGRKCYDEAEAAYRRAIELNPSYVAAYSNLVTLFRLVNRFNDAMLLLEKMKVIAPDDFHVYLALASISKQAGRNVLPEYLAKARQFVSEDDAYNCACLESVCDNLDVAFEYLDKATQRQNFDSSWAWDDPDLQWIRNDPRFIKVVGEKSS